MPSSLLPPRLTRLVRLGLLAACAYLLAGCGTAEMNQQIDQAKEQAREITEVALSDDTQTRPLVKVYDEPYISDREIAYEDAAWLNEHVDIRVTGLPMNIVLEKALQQLAVPPSVVFTADLVDTALPVTLAHKGLFRDFLDRLAVASGYGWEHKHDTVYWMMEITRKFDISRVPGDVTYSLAASGPGSSALGGGGGGGTGSVDAAPDESGGDISIEGGGTFWDDLETTIETLSSGSTVQYTMDRSTGTVIVRGPANIVRRIGNYIAALNRSLERQVLLEIQVVQVLLNDELQFGIDWKLIRAAAETARGIGESAGSFPIVGAGASLTARFGGESGSIFRHADTQIVISALESQGDTSIQNSPRIIAMNGQAAQLRVMEEQTIIASRSTTTTGTLGVTVASVEPGTVSTGITVTILPKIVARQVILQANIQVSSLLNIASSGGVDAINLPHVQRNQFFQSASLNSGEMLALGGLITERSRDGGNALPGTFIGNTKKEYSRVETVLLITPTLLDPPGQDGDLLL